MVARTVTRIFTWMPHAVSRLWARRSSRTRRVSSAPPPGTSSASAQVTDLFSGLKKRPVYLNLGAQPAGGAARGHWAIQRPGVAAHTTRLLWANFSSECVVRVQHILGSREVMCRVVRFEPRLRQEHNVRLRWLEGRTVANVEGPGVTGVVYCSDAELLVTLQLGGWRSPFAGTVRKNLDRKIRRALAQG